MKADLDNVTVREDGAIVITPTRKTISAKDAVPQRKERNAPPFKRLAQIADDQSSARRFAAANSFR